MKKTPLSEELTDEDLDIDNSLDNNLEKEENELERGFRVIEINQNRKTDMGTLAKNIKIFTLVICCFSALLGFGTYHFFQRSLEAINSYKKVEATVTGHHTRYTKDSKGRSSTTLAPVFEYKFNSNTFISTSDFSCSGGCYDRDERVEVLVNPKDPNVFLINSFMGLWLAPLGMGVIFLILSSISLFILRKNFKTKGNDSFGFNDTREFCVSKVVHLRDGRSKVTAVGIFEDIKIKYIMHNIVNKNDAKNYSSGITKLTGHIHTKNKNLIYLDWTPKNKRNNAA